MLNESHNDTGYWKDKLKELDGVPGETLNKAAAWGKLQERLREKSSGKKAAWYWVAAACLLLTFMITRLSPTNKKISLVKNNLPQKPKTLAGTQTPFSDSFIVISTQKNTEKKALVVNKVKTKEQDILPNKNAALEPSIANTGVTNNTIPTYSNANTADTIVLAVLPIKKKLRVVHINDLEKPLEEPNQFAQNNVIPVFQTGALTKTVFSRFVLSKNASDNILKIKLSPSN